MRLVFESAGARYVATRVVRRDGRGNVKTAGAGLQLMPPGFDVTKLDTGLSPDDLGEVLAGTPAEMDQAVLDAVGLPYEQFTSCVVLPQGQFADFLHAKPGDPAADPGQPARPGRLRGRPAPGGGPRGGRPRRSWPRSTSCSPGSTDADDEALAARRRTGSTRCAALAAAVAAAVPGAARRAVDARGGRAAGAGRARRRAGRARRGPRPGRGRRARRARWPTARAVATEAARRGRARPRSARRRCAASWPRPATRPR